MSPVVIGCRRHEDEDGTWTLFITATGLTDAESRELAELTAQPFQAAIQEAMAGRGFDSKLDHVTGERTSLKPETRQ